MSWTEKWGRPSLSAAASLNESGRRPESWGSVLKNTSIELLSQGLDPKERAVEYIEVAEELLSEAREELKRGNVRQAAEKV